MGLLAAGSLVTAVAAQTPAAHPLTPRTLTLGAVDDDIRKHMERLTPLARYLERELADEGIASVQIAVLPDSQSMAEAMRQGDVDLYFDSPLVATRIARMAGAIPILRRWKNGEATYSSVIVVPANSAIASLEDLRGRVVGFQEPDSTSGYMLPVAMLQQAGLPLRHLHRESERPQEDTVGYLFTGDDRNTVLWLVRGTIDAGATDTQGLRWLHDAQPGRFRVTSSCARRPWTTLCPPPSPIRCAPWTKAARAWRFWTRSTARPALTTFPPASKRPSRPFMPSSTGSIRWI